MPPNTSYSIDNGTSQFFFGILHSAPQYQHQFFQSQQLSPGNHTLKITNLVSKGQFYLDFVNITGPGTQTTIKPTVPVPTALSSAISRLPSVDTLPSMISSVSGSDILPTPPLTSASLDIPAPVASSSTVPGPTTLDDQSASFTYHGNWQEGSMSSDYNGTITWTNTSGSSVSIVFTGKYNVDCKSQM